MSTLTDNIALIKEVCGLSANRLAKMAGFPTSTMMRIQSDEHSPHMKTVEAIARAIGLTEYELLFEKLDRVKILDGYRKSLGLPPTTIENPTKEQIAYGKAAYETENILDIKRLLDADPVFVGTEEDEPRFIHPVGSYCFRCESDDLLPRITRGYNLYIKPITTEQALSLPSSQKFVGRESNSKSPVYGHLIVSGDRIRIKPTNPNTSDVYDVDKVCGSIVGLMFFME